MQNQEEFEQDLIQQDVDLILNFKNCIDRIYDSQQQSDRQIRSSVMKAQDCITARIHTFPIPNIDKLDDIEVQIPKIIILNKQIYEILFTYLQTHPCYLINWICAAIRQDIDLFDDHPQAFLDDAFLRENQEIKKVVDYQQAYLNYSEQHIEMDEYCYLMTAIFGGMKHIRNDKRIINTLMIIASKVFEYEIEESYKQKIDYTFDDIMCSRVECAFARLHRQIFHCQYQNTAFIEELFEQIVVRLYRDRK